MKRIAYHVWVWALCLAVCACAVGFLIGRLSAGDAVRVRTGHPAKDVVSAAVGSASEETSDTASAEAASAPRTPTADAPLDLNTATKEELMLLPRIGETLAERILAYRAENGRFIATEQLMDIDGIGEGTYASLRELVTVEDNS